MDTLALAGAIEANEASQQLSALELQIMIHKAW